MKESPLVSVIVHKIQERYLSKANLDRLRKALQKEQARNKPKPQDLARMRQEIDRLSSKIDNSEDAVLDAPTNLRPGLYRKLEALIEERKRLIAELDGLSRQEVSAKDCQAEVNRAIDALQNLGEALGEAKPEDTKELLSSIVTKIELFYDHEDGSNGRKTSTFTHGLIYVRPDAGAGRGTDPKSTLMTNKRPYFDAHTVARDVGGIPVTAGGGGGDSGRRDLSERGGWISLRNFLETKQLFPLADENGKCWQGTNHHETR